MLKLFRFLKPHRGLVAVVVTLMLLQALSELFLPTLMSDIVDTGIIKGNTGYILRIGGVMLLVAAAGAICAIVAGYFSARVSMGFGKILRNNIFTQVEHFSLHQFDTFSTASLITRTTNDITQIQFVTMMLLRMFITAPIMAAGGVIMAVYLDPELSLVLVAAIPILVLAVWLTAGQSVPL